MKLRFYIITSWFLIHASVSSQILKIENIILMKPLCYSQKYVCAVTRSFDLLPLNAKLFCARKYRCSFLETWNFTYFHWSRTSYTTQLVKSCHIILSSLIIDPEKIHMNSAQNPGTHNARVAEILWSILYIYQLLKIWPKHRTSCIAA